MPSGVRGEGGRWSVVYDGALPPVSCGVITSMGVVARADHLVKPEWNNVEELKVLRSSGRVESKFYRSVAQCVKASELNTSICENFCKTRVPFYSNAELTFLSLCSISLVNLYS